MIDILNVIFGTVGVSPWEVFKWLYVFGFFVYFLFSLIVWRQIDLMSKTLSGAIHLPIKFVGVGMVLVAGVALAVAMMIL